MKSINITHNNEKYTLEFDRASVKYLEDQGFIADDVVKKPMTMIPMLFYTAFRKHHSGIKRKTVDAIYDELENKEEILGAMLELYAEPVETLFENKTEGNAKWVKNW